MFKTSDVLKHAVTNIPAERIDDECAEAREDVAAKLERLARRIRAGTTTGYRTMQWLEDAYTALVKFSATYQALQGPSVKE